MNGHLRVDTTHRTHFSVNVVRWLRVLLVTTLFVSLTACVAKPKIADSALAPDKFRCQNKADQECKAFRKSYSTGPATFTCANGDTENCDAREIKGDSDYFNNKILAPRFNSERGLAAGRTNKALDKPYQIGLALAGGGTKAADYAIGILAGLHEPENKNLNEKIDAISSVSGGTYAAVWYFSRLIEESQINAEHLGKSPTGGFQNVFVDCLPRVYAGLAAQAGAEVRSSGDPELCPPAASQFRPGTLNDKFRFQNHLRGFQSLFEKDFVTTEDLDKADSDRPIATLLREFAYNLPVVPVNWFANGLFDAEVNFSTSGKRYFNGIRRTFGLRPVNCKDYTEYARADYPAPLVSWGDLCGGDDGRPSPNTAAARGQTMAALGVHYYGATNSKVLCTASALDAGGPHKKIESKQSEDSKNCRDLPRIPFWIANTTAGVERYWLSYGAFGPPDFEDAVFEFTPYSFGSRHFGRWIGTPGRMELTEIAGASGAFLDSQQRTAHPIPNMIASWGMRSLAASWGVSIPNPRWRDEVRLKHRLLPFPLYLLHNNKQSNEGAFIHLSDGGQSENTGVWSLIRRGVGTIIVADESQDKEGTFTDLCYLRDRLKERSLYLRIPDLDDFKGVCKKDKKDNKGKKHYDLRSWAAKFVEGCITSEKNKEEECVRHARGYFARLIVLKPAIDLKGWKIYLNRCNHNALALPAPSAAAQTCRKALEDMRNADHKYKDFPAELFGFLVRKFHDQEPTSLSFPQNSTVWMTLHSTPTFFGAYRELAKWQMRGIAEVVNDDQPRERNVKISLAP